MDNNNVTNKNTMLKQILKEILYITLYAIAFVSFIIFTTHLHDITM